MDFNTARAATVGSLAHTGGFWIGSDSYINSGRPIKDGNDKCWTTASLSATLRCGPQHCVHVRALNPAGTQTLIHKCMTALPDVQTFVHPCVPFWLRLTRLGHWQSLWKYQENFEELFYILNRIAPIINHNDLLQHCVKCSERHEMFNLAVSFCTEIKPIHACGFSSPQTGMTAIGTFANLLQNTSKSNKPMLGLAGCSWSYKS